MLVTCKECSMQISDKALQCPHCGIPLKTIFKNPTREKSRKRMKLPNGFGRITKIKGRVRKPYRAMVTIGKDESGRPIGKLLKPVSYFDTYNDAYAALLEYHKNPNMITNNVTVEEVFVRWFTRHEPTINRSTAVNIKSRFKYFRDVKDMLFRDVRIYHIKMVIEEGYIIVKGEKHYPSDAIKKSIKQIWNQMFDYAIEYDLTDKNYARQFDIKNISNKTKKPHMSFSEDELKILWNNKEDRIIRMVLILCYTGLRPKELLLLRRENIHLNDSYMIGGLKTEAGKERVIPIHPLIKDIIEGFLEEGNEYLVSNDHKNYIYHTFRKHFIRLIDSYNLSSSHRLHDGRKTFVTLAKKYNVDEYALKRIIGHSISDLTESVYTDRPISWLISETEKIKQY